MNSSAKRTSACVLVLAAGLLGSACGQDAPTNAEVAKIDETLEEAYNLEDQVIDAVNRLSVDCMVDKGFSLHPLWLTEPEPEGTGFRNRETPDALDVPTLKDARKQGFGYNIDQDSDMEDDDPWDRESEKYRESYETTLYGEDRSEFDDSPGKDETPMKEGCFGEAKKVVYGKPTVTEGPDGETSPPLYGPVMPIALYDIGAQNELYDSDTMVDARDALVECVADKGYPSFKYDLLAGLGMSSYADDFYESDVDVDVDETEPAYELPKGAPWPYEKALAAEIEFATAVAKCADDTGFRKTSETEWDRTKATIVRDNEAEIIAWHDGLASALGKARGLLDD